MDVGSQGTELSAEGWSKSGEPTGWKVQRLPTASKWQRDPDLRPGPSSPPHSTLASPGMPGAWRLVGSPRLCVILIERMNE